MTELNGELGDAFIGADIQPEPFSQSSGNGVLNETNTGKQLVELLETVREVLLF